MTFETKPVFLIVFPLFSWFTGCFEQVADVANPKGYDSHQLSFQYPRNWQISEDTFTPQVHNLFVESPGDALVIIQCYNSGTTQDLKAFSESFSENARTETPLGEFSDSNFRTLSKEAGYDWIQEEFEISLLGESIPHKRIFGTKKINIRQVLLIFQVAIEDYLKAEPGLNLIRDTLGPSPE